jgi:hypothetical protein
VNSCQHARLVAQISILPATCTLSPEPPLALPSAPCLPVSAMVACTPVPDHPQLCLHSLQASYACLRPFLHPSVLSRRLHLCLNYPLTSHPACIVRFRRTSLFQRPGHGCLHRPLIIIRFWLPHPLSTSIACSALLHSPLMPQRCCLGLRK